MSIRPVRFRFCTVLLSFMTVVPLALTQTKTPAWTNGAQEKMCGLGTYCDSLDMGFRNATSTLGETLVTVQVLASFRREYAMVFKRVGSQVKLFRATFENQLWTQLGPPLHVAKTRQDCLEIASTAKLDTAEVQVSPEIAERLWKDFGKVNLDTDSCPRQGGQCAYYMDGTDYIVQTEDGHALRITETGRQKDVRSENPALLDWIHTLLSAARNSGG